MIRRTRVYLAGPYSSAPAANTRKAMAVWSELWNLGYCPFCPHWSHWQHQLTPLPYKSWLEFDREWLAACDVVLRLPGASKGADAETALAGQLGIPVYHTVAELKAAFRTFPKIGKP